MSNCGILGRTEIVLKVKLFSNLLQIEIKSGFKNKRLDVQAGSPCNDVKLGLFLSVFGFHIYEFMQFCVPPS